MKCDELKAIKIELNNNGKPIASIQGTTSYYGISPNDTFYPQDKADEVIAELKEENAQLKKETEFMHSNCKWDCGDGCHKLLGEKLALVNDNTELKKMLEDAKATAYADSVDAGMRERRLKRSLFLMGARLGKMGYLAFHNIRAKLFYLEDEEGMRRADIKKDQWKNVELKCQAKAEEYK